MSMTGIARGRSRWRQGDGSSNRNAAHSTVPNPDHQGQCVPAFSLQIPMALLVFFLVAILGEFRCNIFFGGKVRSPCDEDLTFDLGW